MGINVQRSFNDCFIVQKLISVLLKYRRCPCIRYLAQLAGPLGVGGVRICVTVSVYHPRTRPITDSDLTAFVHEYGEYSGRRSLLISLGLLCHIHPQARLIPFLVNVAITDISAVGTVITRSPLLLPPPTCCVEGPSIGVQKHQSFQFSMRKGSETIVTGLAPFMMFVEGVCSVSRFAAEYQENGD